MRDGLNGPMDENQLWFVETVSQSVSSRGPRRSAHHRLNGHTDGFAQLSNRNSRIRIIGASSLYRGVLRRLCHRYTWVRFMWRLVRVPRRRPLIDLDTRGSAVRSSEVCSSGSSWVGSVGYRPLQLQITRRSVIGVASSFPFLLRFSEFRTKSPFRAWSFNQRHRRRGMADLLRRPGCPGHRGAGTVFRTSQDYDSCIW